MLEWILNPNTWIALVTLTSLEIVLGVDNVIFVSILAGKLPASQQARARRLGLFLAMFMRIGLLLSLTWMMRLTTPLFTVWSLELAGRDLILGVGGLFLIAKSTYEIHDNLEGAEAGGSARAAASFWSAIGQIVVLDIVFSLDSVITAVGMANDIVVMVSAVVIAVGVMMAAANGISGFVDRHPTVKMLALSFLLLIGVSLIADGLHQHISKGYIYFAMAFSVLVEMLNLRLRRKTTPVELRHPYVEEDRDSGLGTRG
jgi:predicted tellurium resistance membrane protein TerC